MKKILETWNLAKFPHSKIPEYKHKIGVGPNYISCVMSKIVDRSSIYEIDRDIGSFLLLTSADDLNIRGDKIYIVSQDVKEWVFLVFTDMDFALLFTNSELISFSFFNKIQLFEDDFFESLRKRKDLFPQHFDSDFIEKIAQFSASYSLKFRN